MMASPDPWEHSLLMRLLRRLLSWKWCLALSALALVSCRTLSFYAQAAVGQWEITSKARPIETVLADNDTKNGVRSRLKTVQEIRQFASEHLGLPAACQYDCYCDLGRKFAVWVVYAAPEFSVKPKTWWYPMLGSLGYRGFFSQADAEREAASLKKAGLDVYVGGVEAYSTLGWFRDPVLNTFLRRSDEELAELLFHELTHQRLYINGDTEFNEALATAIGQEGTRRWLKERGQTTTLKQYNADTVLERRFINTVLQTRGRLLKLYRETSLSPDQMRDRKQHEFARLRAEADKMKSDIGGSFPIERWFSRPVNNARLNTLATYFDLLPGFEALIKEEHGDLERFFARVKAMQSLDRKERRDVLTRAASAAAKHR